MMKVRSSRTIVPLAVSIVVAMGAFAEVRGAQDADRPVNAQCPVMTEEPVDPGVTTTYEGRTIGFCCERCRAKFLASPERYEVRLAAFETDREHPSVGEHGQEHEEHRHDEATGEHAEHEHEHGEADHGLMKLIQWLGRFHPPMVNFPIAMLVGAAVAEILRITTKRPFFAGAGRFCLWFGGVAAVAAGVLGWFFAGFRVGDDTTILAVHRWMGTGTVLWSLFTLIVGERAYRVPDAKRLKGYRALLVVGATLVLVTGFFGGAMIYGLNHYAW